MKKILIILVLFPSLSFGATLDLKLRKPINGYEYNVSLMDTVEAIRLTADYAYGEVQDIVTVDRGSLEIYYDRALSEGWKLWFFNIAQYNNVYSTRDNSFGAGPKYYILNGDHKLSFSTGILYQYDHVSAEGYGRYSHRPKYSYKDWIDAVYYYQPAIESPGDYIEKYNIKAVLPWTQRVGKAYCLREYRSIIGTIDNECGFIVSIEFGGDDVKKN